jgi:hypothetical protein
VTPSTSRAIASVRSVEPSLTAMISTAPRPASAMICARAAVQRRSVSPIACSSSSAGTTIESVGPVIAPRAR